MSTSSTRPVGQVRRHAPARAAGAAGATAAPALDPLTMRGRARGARLRLPRRRPRFLALRASARLRGADLEARLRRAARALPAAPVRRQTDRGQRDDRAADRLGRLRDDDTALIGRRRLSHPRHEDILLERSDRRHCGRVRADRPEKGLPRRHSAFLVERGRRDFPRGQDSRSWGSAPRRSANWSSTTSSCRGEALLGQVGGGAAHVRRVHGLGARSAGRVPSGNHAAPARAGGRVRADAAASTASRSGSSRRSRTASPT